MRQVVIFSHLHGGGGRFGVGESSGDAGPMNGPGPINPDWCSFCDAPPSCFKTDGLNVPMPWI